MKLNQLLLLGVTSYLVFGFSSLGYTAEVSANPSSNAVNSSANLTTNTKSAVAQNQSVAIMSGSFLAAEKPTTGVARIVRQNGHRYLEDV